MLTPLKRKRHSISSSTMDEQSSEEKLSAEDEDFSSSYFSYLPCSNIPLPNPLSISWALIKLTCFQLTQSTTNCVSILLSPIFLLHSLVSDSVHRADEAEKSVESTLRAAAGRAMAGKSVRVLVKKGGVGLVGALYACMVVTAVMGLAVAMGVGLVFAWVEEPVLVRGKLDFDYAHVNPNAVFSLRSGGGFVDFYGRKKKMGQVVPVGHTFCVSLFLLMPESDYNLQIGIFQLTAEIISSNGYVMAKSSQPCMLRFRSLPVRLMRTILMGIPLLLGITEETQKMTIPMLRHKEGYPRSEAIRISMIPRPGTAYVPQLYKAEIIINSQPPWSKEIVQRWKWTFCVWTSMHIYIMLLIILLSCFKPLVLPKTAASRIRPTERGDEQEVTTMEVLKVPQVQERLKEEREVSEALRKWKQRRSERKAMLLRRISLDMVGSASTTSSITRELGEETFVAATATSEEVGDSESVTLGGSAEFVSTIVHDDCM